ncbi:MAG: hypothetical protein J2P36_03130 [Ktedonobacteraceae bacterium]|nr:hypothetical protein [Ktedonobacteraceae bacterium]
MEGNHNASPPHASWEGRQPIILISQLMQQITSMQHVDEVFSWLSQVMVQYLQIPVVQFWASQRYHTGQSQIEVRAAASQNPSLPQQVYTNQQVAAVVGHHLRERHGAASLPVEQIFPIFQASLLARYNLHYWAGYFLKNDALLPLSQNGAAPEQIATPLAMIVSLFTPYPLSSRQMRAANFLLVQALRVIVNRGLLTSRASTSNHPFMKTTPKNTAPALLELIPHRAQDVEQFQADNPFTRSTIIADKHARRLYAAIDGKKNVEELGRITHLEQQVLIDALSNLLQQGHIQLYTQEEKLVDDFSFPSSHS